VVNIHYFICITVFGWGSDQHISILCKDKIAWLHDYVFIAVIDVICTESRTENVLLSSTAPATTRSASTQSTASTGELGYNR